jgi:hypothetical protein
MASFFAATGTEKEGLKLCQFAVVLRVNCDFCANKINDLAPEKTGFESCPASNRIRMSRSENNDLRKSATTIVRPGSLQIGQIRRLLCAGLCPDFLFRQGTAL